MELGDRKFWCVSRPKSPKPPLTPKRSLSRLSQSSTVTSRDKKVFVLRITVR